MRRLALFAALILLASQTGCERPLVDPLERPVDVVGVDLGVVQVSPRLLFGLRVSGATELTVDGRATVPGSDGVFTADVRLERGLNRLAVRASDASGVLATDTLDALYLPVAADPVAAFALPSARTEAAVAASGSRVLVTGGAGAGGAALATMAILTPTGARFSGVDVPLLAARAGHTASTLPDGSVLLVGGSSIREPQRPSDFVTSVEIVRPGATASERVALPTGAPVRAGHTARVLQTDGRTVVYLYGGIVPSGASAATTSGTVDVFEWTAATSELRRLSPEGGAGAFRPLSGHVQIPLVDETGLSGFARDLVAGGDAGFTFSFTLPGAVYPFDLAATAVVSPRTPRVDAAGAPLGLDGLGLVVGGQDGSGGVLATGEVVAVRAGRALAPFRLPDGVRLAVARSGAGATRLAGNRILVAGGRTATGAPTAAVEVFSY